MDAKYCPSCGAEYRRGFTECADCLVPLQAEPPAPAPETYKPRPRAEHRAVVFRSGRRMDAELVRARLEADGLDAWIWSTGLGPWRMESAVTEMTGVPSEFNAHNVVVDDEDFDRAREVLDARGVAIDALPGADEAQDASDDDARWMDRMRDPRVLTGVSLLLLFFLLLSYLG